MKTLKEYIAEGIFDIEDNIEKDSMGDIYKLTTKYRWNCIYLLDIDPNKLVNRDLLKSNNKYKIKNMPMQPEFGVNPKKGLDIIANIVEIFFNLNWLTTLHGGNVNKYIYDVFKHYIKYDFNVIWDNKTNQVLKFEFGDESERNRNFILIMFQDK